MKANLNLKRFAALISILVFAGVAVGQQRRPVTPQDAFRFKALSDPQLSPDGKLVAYVVTTADLEKNKRNSAIDCRGRRQRRAESPDRRYLGAGSSLES